MPIHLWGLRVQGRLYTISFAFDLLLHITYLLPLSLVGHCCLYQMLQ
jgi:hypothetical protein